MAGESIKLYQIISRRFDQWIRLTYELLDTTTPGMIVGFPSSF